MKENFRFSYGICKLRNWKNEKNKICRLRNWLQERKRMNNRKPCRFLYEYFDITA